MAEEEMRDVIARTYATALKAGHESACVAIHVGPDVWEYLKKLNDWPDVKIPLVARMFGFPIILEQGGRPEHISVRTTTVIQ